MSNPASTPVTQLSSTRLVSASALDDSTLPHAPDPLIGREQDIENLLGLLRHPETRLATLTGVGGIGKTRLAIEAAARASAHYADGVVFVALALIREPGHVAPAIAQALGIRETGETSIAHRLIAALVERETLLVVDNLEHVLEAAPVIADLVTACPRLTVLTTSRAALRLGHEREVRVPPLEVPEVGIIHGSRDVQNVAAVRFFVARAKAEVPGFVLTPSNVDAVGEICRRLDGLPLAIMLAAGRTRVLEPTALLDRLEHRLPLLTGGPRDAPDRQRTMRNAITWSYDLLREHQRDLFRRLAVFVGGFTLETMEAMSRELALGASPDCVPPDTLPETPVPLLDALEALIDHHLIEREEAADGGIRFRMLETIREYALEQLETRGQADATRTAHAAAIMAWAERAKPLMFGADQARWLARGAVEQPNVRAALTWALERGDVATAHRLAAANGPVWLKHTLLREAQEGLERVLELPGPAPVEAATVCRFLASSVAQVLGHNDVGLEHARAGLALAREAGDNFGEGLALMMLSSLLLDSDLDGAEQANEAALTCLWALPGRPRVASCFHQRSEIAKLRGDYVQFADLAKKAYEYSADVEDQWSMAVALIIRAEAAYLNNGPPQALAHLAGATTIAQQIDSTELLASALQLGAVVANMCGDHRLAVRWATTGRAEEAALGVSPQGTLDVWTRRVLVDATSAIGQKAVAMEQEAAQTLPLATAVGEVYAYRPGKRTSPALSPLGLARLTSREEEVLRLIASGRTDRQIAEVLFIARPTVSKHVSSILAKLNVESRAAAVDTAHHLGLIVPTESPSH